MVARFYAPSSPDLLLWMSTAWDLITLVTIILDLKKKNAAKMDSSPSQIRRQAGERLGMLKLKRMVIPTANGQEKDQNKIKEDSRDGSTD